jgi:NAD(P)-dependent dehydrogenase (short-subunit alcohol dehydrogenase family)
VDKSVQSKVIVVTGATSGIGLAVVHGLLDQGHAVIGVGRSPLRCAEVSRRLAARFPSGRFAYEMADLGLQGQVRKLADRVDRQLDEWGEIGLDGLLNNAGTFTFWQTFTAEGFETQWAVNHLAPFLLTHLLLPRLKAAPEARVVTVSSGSHRGARLDWNDVQRMRSYNPLQAYKQTKLANVLFTAELNRRLGDGSSVRAFAADPGLVDTEMGMKVNSRLARWAWSIRRRSGIPAEVSAAGIINLLLNPEVVNSKEVYWMHGRAKPPDPAGLDADTARRLWELSAQMCGLVEEVQTA